MLKAELPKDYKRKINLISDWLLKFPCKKYGIDCIVCRVSPGEIYELIERSER